MDFRQTPTLEPQNGRCAITRRRDSHIPPGPRVKRNRERNSFRHQTFTNGLSLTVQPLR